jgi:hypothetical protein
MSHKKVVNEYATYITEADMGSNYTGDSVLIGNIDRLSFEVSWTGVPVGEFFIQVSNNKSKWVTLPLSIAVKAEGSADDAFIDIETAAKCIRLIYTRTSGSGEFNTNIYAKTLS